MSMMASWENQQPGDKVLRSLSCPLNWLIPTQSNFPTQSSPIPPEAGQDREGVDLPDTELGPNYSLPAPC
jgi:hypothetical protein